MHGKTAEKLKELIRDNPAIGELLAESIRVGRTVNPDPEKNPVHDLETFCDYLDWTECPLPWEKMKFAQSGELTETIDQAMAYFYFLLDQPLPGLEGRGLFRPCLVYAEEMRNWVNEAVSAWGRSLALPQSWTDSTLAYVQETPAFRMQEGWYEDPSNWHSFNDFFSRKLRDPSVRPVSQPENDAVCVSPADSEFQGVWDIGEDSVLAADDGVCVKSKTFRSVASILGEDSAYAGCFAGGKMTHSFLGITDYHRYHFPVSGIIREVRLIPALDAAGGVMFWDTKRKRYNLELGEPEWQSIETRGCVIVETESFGNVAVIPIGMCQVSSVNFTGGLEIGKKVRKGDPLGHFLYGGSDFMMLFEKRAGFEYTVGLSPKHLLVGEEFGRMQKK